MDEPVPRWPQDDALVAEMNPRGLTGKEALEAAFSRSYYGRDMGPGDVVGLDDGTLPRSKVEGWAEDDITTKQ